METGALLVDRARVPYVVGCVLPSEVIHTERLIPTRLTSALQTHQGRAALELHAYFEVNGQKHHLQFVLPFSAHRDFLRGLCTADALYLLTGSERPDATTIHKRMYQGGLAIEMNEAVRNQILLFDLHAHVTAATDEYAVASI
ncbi:hypothetical protein CIG75_04955 [Tumebacillus algifaecis]|uniref:Uncharacterized protein n=1 Tax=Tumebacillus algifaecis TaxID=1214604 RepID=A0A223CYZ5_9BACL|nr:hypothetical protein [Tumebacillus algifaecis]ASS74396.1 hypothetical protein CIG75_04955 [Tumebacillus algifaecis]